MELTWLDLEIQPSSAFQKEFVSTSRGKLLSLFFSLSERTQKRKT